VSALPFLSDEEIDKLCAGLQLPGAQCRYLTRLGLLVNRKPNGRPLVARSVYEAWKNPPPPPPVAPWVPPPHREWSETPLGRMQAEQRAIAAERRQAEEESQARWHAEQEATRPLREEEQRLQRAALVRFHANKRRVIKLQRTPAWADDQAIRAIYLEAQRLTNKTGIPHHVDHEIPLQGKMVSGLHVQNNLQILTGSENSRKRNRFEIKP